MFFYKIIILTLIIMQINTIAFGQEIDQKSISIKFASKTEELPFDVGNYFNAKISDQINQFNALSINQYADLMAQVRTATLFSIFYKDGPDDRSLNAWKFATPPEYYFETNNLFKALENSCFHKLGAGYLPIKTDAVSFSNIEDITGVSYTALDLSFSCKKDCINRRKTLASLKKQYNSDYNYIKISMSDEEILKIGDEHFDYILDPADVYNDLPAHTREWLYQTHQIYNFWQFASKLYNSYQLIVNKKKLESELLSYCPPSIEAETLKLKRYE